MSKLSREKKQSILDTFAKNKQYKATAKIEGVDPRTVKSVVRSQSKAYDVTSESTPNTSARARVDLASESTQLGFQSVNNELSRRIPIDAQDFRKMQQDVKIIKRIVMKSLPNREIVTKSRLTNKVRHWPINKNSGLLKYKGPGSGYYAAEFMAAMKRHGMLDR